MMNCLGFSTSAPLYSKTVHEAPASEQAAAAQIISKGFCAKHPGVKVLHYEKWYACCSSCATYRECPECQRDWDHEILEAETHSMSTGSEAGAVTEIKLEEIKLKILLVGSMGCGKSTFVKALCGNKWAEAGISATGVTTKASVCLIKKEICEKIGMKYGAAAIIDCPGTGDPNLPLSKIIHEVESSIQLTDLHGVFLMNVASDSRINIASRVASFLMEKSFIESADQIVGIMTQCDKERPSIVKQHCRIWKESLQASLKLNDVPIAKCAIPVMEGHPYDVFEDPKSMGPYWREGTPHLEEVYEQLFRLAKELKVMKYKPAADTDIVVQLGRLMGLHEIVDNHDKVQAEIQLLREMRENTAELKKLRQENEGMIMRMKAQETAQQKMRQKFRKENKEMSMKLEATERTQQKIQDQLRKENEEKTKEIERLKAKASGCIIS